MDEFKSWLKTDTSKPFKTIDPEAKRIEYLKEEQAKRLSKAKVKKSNEKLDDLGEKIGDARKDTSVKIGKRTKTTDSKTPAWRKRYVVVENLLEGVGSNKWNIFDSRTNRALRGSNYRAMEFSSLEEAEKMLPIAAVAEKHFVRTVGGDKFSIWRRVGTKKLVRVTAEEFDAREKAMKYMATHAEELLESKLSFGEEVLPTPEKVYREGESRRDGNIKGEDFMEIFGFRGVEFGNWNNQAERQEVMNHAYDSLLDMAEIIGIPPKAVSLNGELALAFGARGQGLSGAKAHYEPGHSVINLTKMSGAGSLAHEWFHSLDHYFGRIDGKAATKMIENSKGNKVFNIKSDKTTFASHGFLYSSKARPEIQEAYTNLITTMFKKAEKYVEDTANAEKYVGKSRDELAKRLDSIREDISQQKDPKYWKRNNKPATTEQLTRFNELADSLVSGESIETELRLNNNPRATFQTFRNSNDILDEMAEIYKKVRGRGGFKPKKDGVFDQVSAAVRFYSDRVSKLKEANNSTEKTKKVPTSFYMQARSADQARSGDYWSSPHEMAARAFAAYVEDRMADKQASNDFLAYHAHGAVLVPVYPEGLFRPYPEGKEREAVNKSFDNLFRIINAKKTDKGVALFSKISNSESAGLSVSKTEKIVKDTTENWKNAPKIKVVQSIDELPKYLSDYVKSVDPNNKTEGLFAPREKTIYLIANNLNDAKTIQRVIFHEALGHYGLREMFGNDIKPILNRVFMSYGKGGLEDIAKLYGLDLNKQSDRLIAAEEKLAQMAENNEKPTVLNNIVKAIRELIRKLGINLKLSESEIKVMLADMRKFVTDGAPVVFNGGGLEVAIDPRLSIKNNTVSKGIEKHTQEIAKHVKNISSLPQDKRKVLLTWMTERQLVETYRDNFQGDTNPLMQYSEERQAMGAFVQRELHNVDATDAKWEKLGKAESDKLSDVMLDATFYEIHPDQAYESVIDVEVSQSVIKAIGSKIDAIRSKILLTPGGTFMGSGFSGEMASKLKGLNRHLESVSKNKELDQNETQSLVENLKEQILKLQEIVNQPDNKNNARINEVKELEKKQKYFVRRIAFEKERMSEYDKLVSQYSQLSDDAKEVYKEVKNGYTRQWADLQAALEDRIRDAINNKEARADALSEIKLEFNKALSKGPYFPLARFGDYVVTATDSDGDYVREHAESEAEQEQLMKDLRRSGHVNIKNFKQKDMKVEDFKASPGLMTNIFKILSDNGVTSTGVMDDVYQVVLKTMPEMSYAKKAIHRKRTKGFSRDTRRAHAYTMFHGWNHISKIRYGHKLQEQLDKMQEMADAFTKGEESPVNSKNSNAAQDLIDHMNDRHELVMNPKSASWTSKAGNIGFIWLLGASPAAGLVNLSQTAMVTFPLLAAKFGYMKAAKALFSAAADYAKSPFKPTSHESWKSLSREGSPVTTEERQMLLDRIADSTIDATQAHWVAQLADTDIRQSASGEMRSGTKKVMRYVSSMFHNAEVANREVSLLAAYRLSKEQGMTDPAKYAQKVVWDSHFDYSSQNRAQAMKNDFIKVATMMKNFSQHMIYAYFSRFIKSIKHEDKAIREQARRELIGITGMHALFAGTLGMAPFIGEIFTAMDMAMGDEDEPVDSKVDFQNWAHDTFGPVMGIAITKGVFNAVGIDIHSRLNIDDLILRENDRDKEGRNAATYYLEQIAGPMFGITANIWQGLSDIGNGEIWRGAEKTAPKFIKDWSKSIRYHTEGGVLSYNREPILETLRMDELAFQFVGFSPARVNAKYSARSAIKGMEKKIKDRRKKLMNQYWITLKAHDHVKRQAVLDDIREFNQTNKETPQIIITFRDIKRSMKGKARASAQTNDGVFLSKRYRFLNEEGRFSRL